jgi:hypothetical protein
MAADVTNKTVETIMQAQQFFPLIGWMYRHFNCSSINSVQVPDDVEILEHVLCCKSPQGNETRRAVF